MIARSRAAFVSCRDVRMDRVARKISGHDEPRPSVSEKFKIACQLETLVLSSIE